MADEKFQATFPLKDVDPSYAIQERTAINPFTREPMTIKARASFWTAERRAAVHSLLEERGATADDDGTARISFDQGAEIGVYLGPDGEGGDESELSIACDGITEEIGQFLFEMLRASDMAIVPEFDEGPPVVVGSPSASKARKRWPEAVLIEESGELLDWLRKAIPVEAP